MVPVKGTSPNAVCVGQIVELTMYPDTQAAQSKVESKYEGFFHELIQPPCILVNKERLQTIGEYRAKHAYRIVSN